MTDALSTPAFFLKAVVTGNIVSLNWPIQPWTIICRDGVPMLGTEGASAIERDVPVGDHTYLAMAPGKVASATVTILAPPLPKTLLGLWHSNGTVADAETTATALGVSAKLTAYSTYQNPNSSYVDLGTSTMVDPNNPEKLTLLLAVPIAPNGFHDTDTVSNLSVFEQLGAALPDGTVARVGWEPNEGSNTQFVTSAAAYQKAGHGIASALKTGNPKVLVDFCTNAVGNGQPNNGVQFPGPGLPNGGYGPEAWASFYFGDDVVDVISVDFYENGWAEWYVANVMETVALAQAHGKAWAIPEWGLSGKDVPAYVEAMAAVIKGGTVTGGDGTVYPNVPPALYHSLWSQPGTGSDITKFPNSLAAFTGAFG